MDFIMRTARQYQTTLWTGGSTTQLAISPQDASYAHRDFLWRVSCAQVRQPQSDFTPLPQYWRWICLLEGEMHLRHAGGDWQSMQPYEVHEFDGGVSTASRGQCVDFNLMLRKGQGRGSLACRKLTAGEHYEIPAPEQEEQIVLYCHQGEADASSNGHRWRVHAGDSLQLHWTQPQPINLYCTQECVFLLARIKEDRNEN